MNSLAIFLVAVTMTTLIYSEEAAELNHANVRAGIFGHGGLNGATCATILCVTNTTCIDGLFGARCIPNLFQRTTCETVRCTANTTCSQGIFGARCVPRRPHRITCADLHCAANYVCIAGDISAECVRVPTCAETQCQHYENCVEGVNGAECIPFN